MREDEEEWNVATHQKSHCKMANWRMDKSIHLLNTFIVVILALRYFFFLSDKKKEKQTRE